MVEVNDLHELRVVEVRDGWIVECNVPVFPNA